MFRGNLDDYYSQIEEYFDEAKHSELYDRFTALDFKLNKNNYHFENIKKIIGKSDILDTEDYYSDIHLPIYYEVESFLVSLRSSVDILLHLVTFSFDLRIPTNEVNLYTVYNHKKLPKNVKNIFERYTRPFNNATWNFIYTSRNEVVHEKSVNQILPIEVDLFGYEKPTVFFEWENAQRELLSFFSQCLRFLETFVSQFLQSIKISL